MSSFKHFSKTEGPGKIFFYLRFSLTISCIFLSDFKFLQVGCWYRWYKGKYLINKENITFHFAGFSYSSNLTSTGLYIDFKIKFVKIFTFKNSRLLVKYFDIRNVQIISDQGSFSHYFYILFNCTNVPHLPTNPVICSHLSRCDNVASGHRTKCIFQTILMTNYYTITNVLACQTFVDYGNETA